MRRGEGSDCVLDEKLRNGLSLAALCAAALICLQVGVVRFAETGRSSALEHELEAERRDRGHEVSMLNERLDRARGQVLQLRRNLGRVEQENSQLVEARRRADAAAELMRSHLGSLSDTLKEERPFLDVYLTPSETPAVLAAVAENRGTQLVEIRESRGWLWVDGLPLALEGSLGPATLAPGTQIDLFEYDPASENLEFVRDSTEPVRGALCFTYARELEDGSAPWVEQQWFEYKPGLGSTATLRRDSWPLDAGERPCELGAAEPPW